MVYLSSPKQGAKTSLGNLLGNPPETLLGNLSETPLEQIQENKQTSTDDNTGKGEAFSDALHLNVKDNPQLQTIFEKAREAAQAILQDPKQVEAIRKIDAVIAKAQAEQAQAEQEKSAQGKTSESIEELQEALKQYISRRSTVIAYSVRKHNQWSDREIGIMKDIFPNNDNEQAVERREVTFVGNPVEKDMANPRIPGDTLLIQPMLIDGIEWTALKIPASIKEMKLSDLSGEFMVNEDAAWFPEMDMTVSVGEALGGEALEGKVLMQREALGSDWLILAKHNKKTDNRKITRVNIKPYYKSADTDVVRECLREGTKPMGLAHTLVLREIIKQGLGDKYVDFPGYKADSDSMGYHQIRTMIDKIDEYTGLSFGDKDGDYIMIGRTKYIIRTLGVYRNKKGNLHAFIRGAGGGVGGVGGVTSLDCGNHIDFVYDPNIGFRSCL